MAWSFVRSIYTYQLYNNSSEKVKHPQLVTTCFHVQLPCIVDRNIQYKIVKWIPPFHKPVSYSVQYRDSTIQLVITPNPSLNFFTRYGCGMDIFPAIPFFSFSCHILGPYLSYLVIVVNSIVFYPFESICFFSPGILSGILAIQFCCAVPVQAMFL